MPDLEAGCRALGITLSTQQLDQFAAYQALLISWNERLNLTAVRTPQEIQRRHFVDSLSCALVTGDLTGQRMIDVGTGAGFPGLPLKLLYPGLRLTLLESVRKKASFLAEMVVHLDLQEVTICTERAEELGHHDDHRESYDWAVARAVSHLSPLLEYLLPFCRIGGQALAPKGARAQQEAVEAAQAAAQLGGGPIELIEIPLEDRDTAYQVLVKKVAVTPERFPRRVGVPVKRPL